VLPAQSDVVLALCDFLPSCSCFTELKSASVLLGTFHLSNASFSGLS
jgi:hypothetical protein